MGAFLDRLQSPPPQPAPQPAPPPPPLRAAPPSPSQSMSPLQLPSPVVPVVPAVSAAARKGQPEGDRLQKLRAGSKKRTRAYNPEAVAVAVPKRRRESV